MNRISGHETYMIRYLQHSEIDKMQWDACISKAANPLIYGYAWYLDLVSDDWDGLVLDEYTAVFPLTHRRKYGFRYLCQPDFAQQLGPFIPEGSGNDLVDIFLDAIPSRFRFAEISLNSSAFPSRHQVVSRTNYELSLKPGYDMIRQHYTENLTRNLKKASSSGLYLATHPDITGIIRLFRENRGQAVQRWGDREYLRFRRLYHTLEHRGQARAWGAYDCTNELVAGAVFFFDPKRAYFVFSGLSPEGREKGAMPLLLDNLVQQFAGTDTTLDFEGSMEPGLARFYASFGASLKHYWFYRINKLPFPLKGLK